MASLPMVTWIRFAIWSIIGVSIYFLYGMKHSTLNDKQDISEQVGKL